MIAVVLARGEGRRMRERPQSAVGMTPAQDAAAAAGRKVMMPVGEGDRARPFLDYVLASLSAAGCDHVCLVVAPDHDDVRRRYLAEHPPRRLRIEFAIQAAASGTADAVLAAEPLVRDAPFLVVNADNLYPDQMLRDLVECEGPAVAAFARDELIASGNIPAARVADYALIDVDRDGWLRHIIEKPGARAMAAAGPDALVSMNAWRFDRRIFDACRDVPPSGRGERELPGAVTIACDRGVRFRAVRARGRVLDLSRPGDIAEVSRQLGGVEVDL